MRYHLFMICCMGIGMGDMLVREFGEYKPEAHKFGRVELCTFSAALKREIFPKLREAMEGLRLRIPTDAALRTDLSAMQQVCSGGQFSYEAPRTKDGHSDRCTAAALCGRVRARLLVCMWVSFPAQPRARAIGMGGTMPGMYEVRITIYEFQALHACACRRERKDSANEEIPQENNKPIACTSFGRDASRICPQRGGGVVLAPGAEYAGAAGAAQ